jgi:hypothetical protein
MASFLLEAFKGIKAEMEMAGTLPAQLRRLPKLLGILAAEIASLLSLIPYAVSTMALYRSGDLSWHRCLHGAAWHDVRAGSEFHMFLLGCIWGVAW